MYSFFRRWTPELQFNPLTDEEKTPENQHPSKQHDDSSKKGFIFMSGNECQLNDNYPTSQNSNHKNKKKEQSKKTHYLSRQNSLFKDWEVRPMII